MAVASAAEIVAVFERECQKKAKRIHRLFKDGIELTEFNVRKAANNWTLPLSFRRSDLDELYGKADRKKRSDIELAEKAFREKTADAKRKFDAEREGPWKNLQEVLSKAKSAYDCLVAKARSGFVDRNEREPATNSFHTSLGHAEKSDSVSKDDIRLLAERKLDLTRARADLEATEAMATMEYELATFNAAREWRGAKGPHENERDRAIEKAEQGFSRVLNFIGEEKDRRQKEVAILALATSAWPPSADEARQQWAAGAIDVDKALRELFHQG